MESHFFAYMYRLKYIERWSLMRNVMKENVAEHSYQVAILAHLLAAVGKEVFGKAVDPERAATLALFHDATEMFTGDIPTPVKHHNPEILANFRKIETAAAERLLEMAPEELAPVYQPLLTGRKEDEPLTAYVKAADLLDAYLKCVSELSAGNGEFAVAKGQIEAAIQKLGMPEVDWFLTRMAPSFERTLDEMSRTTTRSETP